MRLVNIPRIGVSVGEGRDRVFCDERFAEPPSTRESTGSRVMTNSTKRFTSILICALVLSGTISAKTDGTRVFEISFFSGVLQREMPVSIVAPSARSIAAPVLVLLHGRRRNHRDLGGMSKPGENNDSRRTYGCSCPRVKTVGISIHRCARWTARRTT